MTISVKKVKKGDTVMVLQGKDAGRRGKVLRVLPREQKVIVENLNIVKRHTRPSTANPQEASSTNPRPWR